MASYLERYRAGERVEVWAELMAAGGGVRTEPLYSDAQDVAKETMFRVRHNVDLLIPRLTALGYQYGAGFLDDFEPEERAAAQEAAPVFAPPPLDTKAYIAQFKSDGASLPLSLQLFYEVVGSVNLVGALPADTLDTVGTTSVRPSTFSWTTRGLEYGLDPLFVYPIKVAREMFRLWRVERESRGQAVTPYEFPLSPDYNDKYGISGGGPYSIIVPCQTVDVPLRREWHQSTFVGYLRICFQWGGLPGLERSGAPPKEELAYITQGLLPI